MCQWDFVYKYSGYGSNKRFGSGALPDMLFVRIIKNDIVAYFRLGFVKW